MIFDEKKLVLSSRSEKIFKIFCIKNLEKKFFVTLDFPLFWLSDLTRFGPFLSLLSVAKEEIDREDENEILKASFSLSFQQLFWRYLIWIFFVFLLVVFIQFYLFFCKNYWNLKVVTVGKSQDFGYQIRISALGIFDNLSIQFFSFEYLIF